MVEKIQI